MLFYLYQFWNYSSAAVGIVLILICGCKKEVFDLPDLSTLPVIEITANSAKSGGYITDDGGAKVTARGVVYGEQYSFKTYDGKIADIDGNNYYTVIIGNQDQIISTTHREELLQLTG